MMNSDDVLRRLTAAGSENPRLETRLLLAAFGGDSVGLDAAIDRLLAGTPLSRILGTQEFYGLEFALSADTLDPRQDTEILVDIALSRFTGNPPIRMLDMGTGTGCIIISILHELGVGTGIATDLSAGALETARRNAARHGLGDRINFVQTSWADGIDGTFDLIVSNPPYIRSAVIPNLAKNVQNYDPILALDGGVDGLDAYKSIVTVIKNKLAPGGTALLEIGFDQGDDVMRLVANTGATRNRLHLDLAGNPRVVEISYGDN